MKPRPRLAIRCAAAAFAAWTTGACRPRETTNAPTSEPAVPVQWSAGDVLGLQPISAAVATSPAMRVARLDALVDLLDAARFADDAAARERLWIGLGGTAKGRGPDATREASSRLLAEAIQLDTSARPLRTSARPLRTSKTRSGTSKIQFLPSLIHSGNPKIHSGSPKNRSRSPNRAPRGGADQSCFF